MKSHIGKANELEIIRQCDQCSKEYTAKTRRSRYCSGACRAKHSRAAHGAIVDNRHAAIQRTIATRSAQHHSAVCPICGATFDYTGNGRRRVYCSPRCRKLAFNAAHNEPEPECAAAEHETTVDKVSGCDVLVEMSHGSLTLEQIIFVAARLTAKRLAPQEGRVRHPNAKSIPRYAA